jgi:hypothetical protein
VVRFADDIVVGFRDKADADQFRAELTERMKKFNLKLHPEKTRLLEFGPFAIDNRQRRGERKPETFNFLGWEIRLSGIIGGPRETWPWWNCEPALQAKVQVR